MYIFQNDMYLNCTRMIWVGFTLVVLVTSGDLGLLMEMVHDKCSTFITEFSTTLTTILPISSIVINTVIVTAETFEP